MKFKVLFRARRATALAAAVACGGAGVAEALPITTAVGDGADASVMLTGAADSNFGSESLLHVTRQIGVDHQFTYLRFDLSGISDPIVDVQVELVRRELGFGSVNFFGLNDAAAGNDWEESGITWNTAPGRSGGGLDTALVTPLGGYGGVSPPGTDIFSTAALLAFVQADSDGLVTLILGGSTNIQPGGVFASKENPDSAAPTLNLTLADSGLTAVSEPASLGIFALGLLGLAALTRRRDRTA